MKTNPDGSGWVLLGALVAGGVLAAVWYGMQQEAEAAMPPPTPMPGPAPCAGLSAGPDAPYGWMVSGTDCVPVPAPAEAENCGDREIWTAVEGCVVAPWNRLPEPPNEGLAVDPGQPGQLNTEDLENLDLLGYQGTVDGVYAFQQDFNLVNALLTEQGSPTMGPVLAETGQINDETRVAMGWALAYEGYAQLPWQGVMDKVQEMVK